MTLFAGFDSLAKAGLERIEVSQSAFTLAQFYIDEKVVGTTSFDDCVHIATVPLVKVDILLSWNFKHIVNIFRIMRYNSDKLRLEHGTLEIRSLKDIIGYEDEG